MSIKSGALRGDKTSYRDGIGCCVWYPMSEAELEMGMCFDFSFEDIDDFIKLLKKLKRARAEVYEEGDE